MNKREMFDFITSSLLAQGRAGIIGSCSYRTSDGKKCAVGMLISDEAYEAYHSRIEGRSIHAEFVMRALRDSGVDIDDGEIFDMLHELQQIHDLDPVVEWQEEFDDLKQVLFGE